MPPVPLALSGLRVLLIESDPRTAERVGRGLREEGLAVDVTRSGSTGEAHAGRVDYDVIVVDWMLPDKAAPDVCRELRRRDRSIPILMLMVRDSRSDRIAVLDAGADDCLTRPFAFEELVARIRALLRRSEHTRPQLLRVGDLALDRVEQRVSRQGIQIVLTPTEYAILEVMMLNAPDVVTRTRLAERLWGPRQELTDNLITVHVGHLRRKIDGAGRPSLIEAVRGRGYRLVTPERGGVG